MDEGDVELAAAAAFIVKAKGRRIVNGSRRMREKGIANRYSLVLVESNCYCLHDVWDDGCVLDFDIISRGAKSELLLPLAERRRAFCSKGSLDCTKNGLLVARKRRNEGINLG